MRGILGWSLLLCSFQVFSIAPQNQSNSSFSSSLRAQPQNDLSLDHSIEFNSSFQAGPVPRSMLNEMVVKQDQKIDGIKVFGSKIIDHYLGQQKVARIQRVSKNRRNMKTPLVPLFNARKISKERFGIKRMKSELIHYPTNNGLELAWHIEEIRFDRRLHIFVSAETGEVLDHYNGIAHLEETKLEGVGVDGEVKEFNAVWDGDFYKLINREHNNHTYVYSMSAGLPGYIGKSETGEFENAAAIDAHYYSQKVLEILKEEFNRISYDNRNARVRSTVNFTYTGQPYINAFWNGRQLVYGLGDDLMAKDLSGALDVVGHEIAHALTEKTSGLIYRNESGALNEAFSDIVGTYIEYRTQRDKFDWKIAEDVWTPGTDSDALRYMYNPTLDLVSKDYYPERYVGDYNRGGVHINSGIANLAFYLISEGGFHPRYPKDNIQGIGMEMAMKIFYKAFTEFLSPSATFLEAKQMTEYVAKDFGENVLNTVRTAWLAVGVGIEDPDPGNPDPGPGNPDPGDPDPGPGNPDPGPAPDPIVVTNSDRLDIPDRDFTGVKSRIRVTREVETIKVSVDITHPYISQLRIKAVSPKGRKYTLHNRWGGSDQDIVETYEVKVQRNDASTGNWSLHITDAARGEVGNLNQWSIEF